MMGGQGSGHKGHAGRPGKHGGSLPGSGAPASASELSKKYIVESQVDEQGGNFYSVNILALQSIPTDRINDLVANEIADFIESETGERPQVDEMDLDIEWDREIESATVSIWGTAEVEAFE